MNRIEHAIHPYLQLAFYLQILARDIYLMLVYSCEETVCRKRYEHYFQDQCVSRERVRDLVEEYLEYVL